jgi:hypothetical protein
MLRSWVLNKSSIEKQPKGSYRQREPWKKVKEEQMEIELNQRFEQVRAQGKKVTAKWLLRHARDIYGKLHPDRVVRPEHGRAYYLGFKFSEGWMNAFKKRYYISFRAGTKQAQKSPEDLLPVIQKWLQFNRRMTIVQPGSNCGISQDPSIPTVGRFKLSEIANMDQSPLPFELQKGRTYAQKGSNTVSIRRARSGWEKRQCTLQLIVFADGIPRAKPLLMFHGIENSKDTRRLREKKKYHPGVVVIFNPKAYANTSNLIDWVRRQYRPASAYSLNDHEPRLLVLDAFAPHKNKGRKVQQKESQKAKEKRLEEERLQQQLREEFTKLNTTLSIIPGGCTGYVQVLDVSVNKLIKQYIEEAEEAWIDKHMEQWKAGQFTIGDRRVLMTNWVAEAWEKVHTIHKDTIIKTFRQVGLALNPDGSEDSELKIKDLPGITVGDFDRPVSVSNDDIKDSVIEVQDREEDEEEVTTDSGDDTGEDFDYDAEDIESEFNEEEDGDEEEGDHFMD